ncbi:Hypothetical predicted protein [Lecanosticta acicola]|uniref:Uncharacterized protein n=1 Tax=Lecanosticta acicola TaxID=111012 RepID=A0AAI8YRT8_9PEZI|nr:Hypothetical predicted protein [Lecanosticta acicola]
MPLIRANALRSILRQSAARATSRAAGSARTTLVARRFASSGGHAGGHGEPSSDLPWLLGALTVTPIACWYLWPDTAHAEHHDDHGHDEHAEEGGETEEGGEAEEAGEAEEGGEEEKPSEDAQSNEDEAAQEASAPGEQAGEEGAPEKGAEAGEGTDESKEGGDDGEDAKKGEQPAKPSGSQGEAQPNPARSEAQGTTEQKPGSAEKDSDIEGVQFKGKMAEGSAGLADERKSEPVPSKGSRTKRIDSGLGKKLGQGETYTEDGQDAQAASKDVSSSQGDISNKQKGISTTDAKHSHQIDQDPEKSKKGSGGPETAKAKGTIDPRAPVR